jgi:hypothetical protein
LSRERGARVAWFAGTEAGTGQPVRGVHLPQCSTGRGRTVIYDPYSCERYDVDASTLRPIEPVRQSRVVRLKRPEDNEVRPGMSRRWHRVVGGKLYAFQITHMPNGELRTLVQVYTGCPTGPSDRATAWDSIRHGKRPARKRPPCPTCNMAHKVIGTCTTCRNLVCRSCDGSVLHVDPAEIYGERHGDHAARWQQAPGAEILFLPAE